MSADQYGSLLVPVIMSKLPHEVRVQVARNTANEVWKMSDLLEVIRHEVDAREISEGVKANVNFDKFSSNNQKTPTANTLLSQDSTRPLSNGIQVKCTYCGNAHFSASCQTVSDPKDRFEILERDGRCFVCFKTGHQGSACKKEC